MIFFKGRNYSLALHNWQIFSCCFLFIKHILRKLIDTISASFTEPTEWLFSQRSAVLLDFSKKGWHFVAESSDCSSIYEKSTDQLYRLKSCDKITVSWEYSKCNIIEQEFNTRQLIGVSCWIGCIHEALMLALQVGYKNFQRRSYVRSDRGPVPWPAEDASGSSPEAHINYVSYLKVRSIRKFDVERDRIAVQ